MLPNMSRTIKRFAEPYTLKSVTQAVVNFRPVDSSTTSTIKAVVQSASPTLLNVLDVDTSLRYYQVHTCDNALENDIIVINGGDYRLIKGRDYSQYGFVEFVAEEIKQL